MPDGRDAEQDVTGIHAFAPVVAELAVYRVLPELVEAPMGAGDHVDRTIGEVGVDHGDEEDVAAQIDAVYSELVMPLIFIEPAYVHNTGNERGIVPSLIGHSPEQPGATGQHVREQAWATFLRGGIGIMHGDEDLWPTNSPHGLYSGGGDWRRVLDDPTGGHDLPFIWLGHLWNWLATVDWDDLQPDPRSAPEFLVQGVGSGTSRASSAYAPTLAAAYFPSARTIQIDTTVLTGADRVRVRWFDPASNAEGAADWVLIVDAAA